MGVTNCKSQLHIPGIEATAQAAMVQLAALLLITMRPSGAMLLVRVTHYA